MIRLLRVHLRSQAGIAAIYLLMSLATLVGTLISIGLRYGLNSPEWQLIKQCEQQVRVAKAAIAQILVANPNEKLGIDDPNVVILERCQALAEQLKNDPAFGNKAGALGGLVNSSLSSIDKCALTEPTAQAVATPGRDYASQVIATIPAGSFSPDFAAQATISGGGVAAAVPLTKKTGSDGITTWSGKLTVPGSSSKNVADGATSTIAVTAAGTAMEGADGQEKPIVPRPDGTCPFGLVRVGAVCRITCTVSLPNAVVWKVPPPIKATLSAATTDAIGATLTWETENATSIRLEGPGIPGGGATLGKTGSFPVKRGLKEETYTLTASADGLETKTATAPVPAAGPFAITLSSGGNDITTDFQVTVGGNVTPAPPAGTVVAVGVNGVPVANVSVDGGGSYFATVQLAKTTSVGKLVLTNPARNLTACGSHPPSIVTLANGASSADVQNFFNAAVVKSGGGTNSNTASLTITHAVKLLSASVSWSGKCSGANDTFSVAGKILREGNSLELGLIPCGISCPSSGLQCAPVASVSVSTSVGSLFAPATWNVDIP
jgi:hypothetical protein